MTLPTEPAERDASSRRAALVLARQSRRPSRLGTPAGATAKPDYLLSEDAGFPGLLKRVWEQATCAGDLPDAAEILLTLGGHVPADVQLRALRLTDECALKALAGRSWRASSRQAGFGSLLNGQERPAFTGEIALTTSGRVLLRVPSDGPLSRVADLVGGVLRIAWSARALECYQAELSSASQRFAQAVTDCRQWLAAAGQAGRHELLENLKDAALRTAPFVLYQEGRQYTNFRDRNTLTGKTLWPGHPDCALSSLQTVPLDLWPDADVVLVVGLTLLVRSAGYGRIEEANGTQLSVDHVAELLERTRRKYNSASGAQAGQPVPPAPSGRVADLSDLALALGARRRAARACRSAVPRDPRPADAQDRAGRRAGRAAQRREAALCARLAGRLPVAGSTIDELSAAVAASPGWLARPHGEFGTGLESLVYETVHAAVTAYEADFAMSRGLRSLSALIAALRAGDWARLTQWDLPHYFCCVVPAPQARRHFAGSPAQLADIAWAISSRMQYNSWHFLPGNLPPVAEVTARDYFVPPTIPDVAYFSDQHHHGHVAAKVRFSIRSPQAVDVLGRRFGGFADLRLLRCDGRPFDEQDLLAAHRTSAFIAEATSLAATLAAQGEPVEITSFDAPWHWTRIAG